MILEDAKIVLEVFAGHFTDQKPDDPHYLQAGQSQAKGTIRRCIDSRLDPKKDLNVAKGEYFTSTSAGAVIPKYQDPSTSLQTQIDLGYPITQIENADTIIVMGHTQCGANKAMFDSIVSNAKIDSSPATKWMLPIAANGLEGALKSAKARGASEDEMLRLTEKITTLRSIENLYEYSFGENASVQGLVNTGKLKIIGAIRSLEEKDSRGRQKLYVFDPQFNDFIDIEKIKAEYEANLAKSGESQSINDSGEKTPASLSSEEVIVKQGATSRTVAELKIGEIKAGIAALLDRVQNLETQQTAPAK